MELTTPVDFCCRSQRKDRERVREKAKHFDDTFATFSSEMRRERYGEEGDWLVHGSN